MIRTIAITALAVALSACAGNPTVSPEWRRNNTRPDHLRNDFYLITIYRVTGFKNVCPLKSEPESPARKVLP